MRKSVVGVCRVVRVLLVAGEFVSIREIARSSLPLDALFAEAAAVSLQSATRACVRCAADALLVHVAMTATRWASLAGEPTRQPASPLFSGHAAIGV